MPTELDPERNLSRGRTAAYADLIAAVLDLRSSVTTRTFDQVVNEAVTDGRLAPELARELKWLQRQSLLDLVDHAERILPTTIVALEGVVEPAGDVVIEPGDDVVEPADDTAPASEISAAADVTTAPEPVISEVPPVIPEVSTPEPPPQSVDLTARRLLVAGLRTIDERPFP